MLPLFHGQQSARLPVVGQSAAPEVKIQTVAGVILAPFDLYQSGFTSDGSEVSDEILDRTVLEEGQVLLVQTESKGVEPIREAKIVTITRNYVVIVEDSNGEVIRAFQSLGVDLITYAVMSEAEALQL
jgi:hypothetical protein